jgi:toxin-antitoxin system PIN domain toxin
MSIFLLDINVLVALLWTNHEQHREARAWFQSHQRSGWATCPLTQAGFVCISSNPRIFPDAPPPARVVEVLKKNLSHPMHHFWKDEVSFSQAVSPFADRITGHQQTTDAYLFGLAIHKRGVLVTFDTGISALAAEDSNQLKFLEVLRAK